ncbi:MAG: FAD-dependent oxidoreductase [Candidatus Obscuribacterales bacterium]|nr:FAD-dependent oxidoreductase [Candidatus Obscuribacterales bacterium]
MAISSKLRVAIVGAGLAGLVVAARLKQAGFDVEVFDKGRFVGGRLASRDRDVNQFDYGAQYFTAREQAFIEFLQPLRSASAVKPWQGRFFLQSSADSGLSIVDDGKERLVGVPSMRSLAEYIVETNGLKVHTGCRVTSVKRLDLGWSLAFAETESPKDESPKDKLICHGFDYLVLNMPPAQAQVLAPLDLSKFRFTPCIAVMLSFEAPLALPFDGAAFEAESSFFSWIARDSSKPGRPAGERWVLHISGDTAESLWQLRDEALTAEALAKFQDFSGKFEEEAQGNMPKHSFAKVHRWRYALALKPADKDGEPNQGYLFDRDEKIGYCGDWLHSPRVEGAFLSGHRLASAIRADQR